MNTEERDQIFRKCICTYGSNPQIDVAIEEMSELIKALLKWRRAGGAGLTEARACIVDELADVRIMVRQMEILFQCEEEVERRIDFKVDRQRNRLKEREDDHKNPSKIVKRKKSIKAVYTLKPGDSISRVIEKYYEQPDPTYLAEVLRENGIKNMKKLRPGRILFLPEMIEVEEK